MSKLCDSEILVRLCQCFGLRKGAQQDPSLLQKSTALNENSQTGNLIAHLRKHQSDPDRFINVLVRDPKLTLSNLAQLEDEVDEGGFVETLAGMTREMVDSETSDPHTQAYLYYLILKVEVLSYHKSLSLDSLVNRRFDFSTERIVSEIAQNLYFMKNVYKFIVYEDKDAKDLCSVIARRAVFFERLGLKVFKLLVFFSCNTDYCKDTELLTGLCQRLRDYYDLCERYLIGAHSQGADNQKRERLRIFIEVYTRDLLSYLKMFAHNKQTGADETATLGLICVSLEQVFRDYPLNFIKFKGELTDFKARFKALKAGFEGQLRPPIARAKRVPPYETSVEKLPETADDDSAEDEEMDYDPNEISCNRQSRLFTIKEMSSNHEKLSSAFDIADEEILKLETRTKPIVRRSSFSNFKKTDRDFI